MYFKFQKWRVCKIYFSWNLWRVVLSIYHTIKLSIPSYERRKFTTPFVYIQLELSLLPHKMLTWVSKCTLVRPVFAFLGTPPEWPILFGLSIRSSRSPPSAKIMSVQRLTNFSRLTYKTGAGKFIPATQWLSAQLYLYIAVFSINFDEFIMMVIWITRYWNY